MHKKSIKAGALLLAGVLALSACGSSDEAAESAPSGSASSGSASPAPTPSLAVDQDQYTPDEIEAALVAVKESEGLAGEVTNQEALRPLLEGAPDAMAGIVITPEQCDVLASTDIAGVLENANMAILLLSASDSLSVASHPDASVMDKQSKDNSRLMDDCAEFQMEASGQIITATAEAVEVATDAETTQAFRTAIEAAGAVTDTIHISAVSGTTNIQVSMTGAGAAGPESADAVDNAVRLINAVLAELEEK